MQSQMYWNGSWGSDNPINARVYCTEECLVSPVATLNWANQIFIWLKSFYCCNLSIDCSGVKIQYCSCIKMTWRDFTDNCSHLLKVCKMNEGLCVIACCWSPFPPICPSCIHCHGMAALHSCFCLCSLVTHQISMRKPRICHFQKHQEC